MISIITENKEFIGIIISLLGIVIPLAIFLISKSKEQRQLNFEKFHKDLMKGLSNLDPKDTFGLEQQIAIIYEFRNYPEYFPVIKRILHFEINRWEKQLKEKPHFVQIIKEAKETIKFMDKNFIVRFFTKRFLIPKRSYI